VLFEVIFLNHMYTTTSIQHATTILSPGYSKLGVMMVLMNDNDDGST